MDDLDFLRVVEFARCADQRLVLTFGVFDEVSPRDVDALELASELGDVLLVVVHHDLEAKRLLAEERREVGTPSSAVLRHRSDARVRRVSALRCVTAACAFRWSPDVVTAAVMPDVYAADRPTPWDPLRDFVGRYGGRTVYLSALLADLDRRRTRERIARLYRPEAAG